MIKEWNLLRVIACLSIVLLHSTTQLGLAIGYPDIELYDFYRLLLCYATPTFIVLSEIILANRYPDKLPKGFWLKRLKYIYVPFLSFAVIDALVVHYFYPTIGIKDKLLENAIYGDFEGYFILIILQFYALHYLITKYKISVMWLLPFSIYCMSVYLDVVKGNAPILEGFKSYIPFLGWFAYFTIAFVIGKNYKKVAPKLRDNKWLTVIVFFISALIMYYSYVSGNTTVSSKRFDLLLFVFAASAMILAWGQLIPNYNIINIISNYSFGIYLVHWQVQRFIAPYIGNYFDHTSTRVISLFIITLLISMLLIKLISMLPFGSFIVGQVNRKISPRAVPERAKELVQTA